MSAVLSIGELLVYGTVSRGFKAGGIPTLPALWKDQLTDVEAEELLAYEVGFVGR